MILSFPFSHHNPQNITTAAVNINFKLQALLLLIKSVASGTPATLVEWKPCTEFSKPRNESSLISVAPDRLVGSCRMKVFFYISWKNLCRTELLPDILWDILSIGSTNWFPFVSQLSLIIVSCQLIIDVLNEISGGGRKISGSTLVLVLMTKPGHKFPHISTAVRISGQWCYWKQAFDFNWHMILCLKRCNNLAINTHRSATVQPYPNNISNIPHGDSNGIHFFQHSA